MVRAVVILSLLVLVVIATLVFHPRKQTAYRHQIHQLKFTAAEGSGPYPATIDGREFLDLNALETHLMTLSIGDMVTSYMSLGGFEPLSGYSYNQKMRDTQQALNHFCSEHHLVFSGHLPTD